MKNTAILIPARYDSERLPGKPLIEFNGQTMIARIVFRLKGSQWPIFVLTDNDHIAAEAQAAGAMAILERDIPTDKPRNGTERCAFAVAYSKYLEAYDYFVNVQGDLVDVIEDDVEKIALRLESGLFPLVTGYTDLDPDDIEDPNVVKAIVTNGGEMLWCGRGFTYGVRHIGIYGYSRKALEKYPDLMSEYEEKEKLEQLRWLENGFEINVVPIDYDGMEINTQEDVDRWGQAIDKDKKDANWQPDRQKWDQIGLKDDLGVGDYRG